MFCYRTGIAELSWKHNIALSPFLLWLFLGKEYSFRSFFGPYINILIPTRIIAGCSCCQKSIMYSNCIQDSIFYCSSNNICIQDSTGKYIFFDHCNIADLSDKCSINRYCCLCLLSMWFFKKRQFLQGQTIIFFLLCVLLFILGYVFIT